MPTPMLLSASLLIGLAANQPTYAEAVDFGESVLHVNDLRSDWMLRYQTVALRHWNAARSLAC